jgi:hypothetical protein
VQNCAKTHTSIQVQTGASRHSLRNGFTAYAEASPGVFIGILRQDLKSDDPQVLELLRPADSGFFGGCARSGLLWALEILAWNPNHLLEVALLLAELSEHKIDDNWENKPENSLKAIFRAWMPQTSASRADLRRRL